MLICKIFVNLLIIILNKYKFIFSRILFFKYCLNNYKMSESDTLTDQDETLIKNKYKDFDDDQNINMQNLSKNEILNKYFEEIKWNKASNC